MSQTLLFPYFPYCLDLTLIYPFILFSRSSYLTIPTVISLPPNPFFTQCHRNNFSERPICLYHFHDKILSAASAHLQATVPAAQHGLQERCLPGACVSLVASLCSSDDCQIPCYTMPSTSVPFRTVSFHEKQWLTPPLPLGLTAGMTSFWKPPLYEAR